jgi:hypothetical protein
MFLHKNRKKIEIASAVMAIIMIVGMVALYTLPSLLTK